MKFRKINVDDYNIYKNLLKQLTNVNDFSKEDFNNYLIETSYKKTFMMIVDDIVVGTGSVILEKKISRNFKNVGHIEDIDIDNNFRRNGYGKELISYLINYCKINNCYKIILNCDEKNKIFYQKNGFVNNNIEMSYYFK